MGRRAFGTDRLEAGPGGTLLLSCSESKGWTVRSPGSQTSAEHPGSAVVWDDERYEVLDADDLPGGGVMYRLAPWDERHTIRVQSIYDAASEAARARSAADVRRRSRRRGLLLLASPVTGLMPCVVQERWETEYAVPAVRLTLISAILPLVWGTLSLLAIFVLFAGSLAGGGGIPKVPGMPWLMFGTYLMIESLVRFAVAMSTARPTGSVLGAVPYSLFRLLAGRSRRPAEAPPVPGAARPGDEEAAALALHDAYLMREAFLAFLSPGEQRRLAERFGFEPLRWGRLTAWGTLGFSAAQALSSYDRLAAGRDGAGSIPPLLLALALGAEQVSRLRTLGKGEPAGSVLGHLVRPSVRRLLA